MRPIITLTTDFGVSSPYVAQIKGEILNRNSEAIIVDVSHAIGPQNILEGAVVLADVSRCFPAGTLHVAVVDPGVGTDRKLLYAEIESQQFLAPDNGLLTLLAQRSKPVKLVELCNEQYWNKDVSNTFHGRDILAPVAAHLSLGVAPQELGPAASEILMLPIPRPQLHADYILGHVLLADSFGNLITNISREQITSLGSLERLMVSCRDCSISGISRTYGDRRPGEPIALLDSQGRLEIAIAHGSAARVVGAESGACVTVQRHDA